MHAVNLQQAGLADERTHTALHDSESGKPSPAHLQLYVDCKLGVSLDCRHWPHSSSRGQWAGKLGLDRNI